MKNIILFLAIILSSFYSATHAQTNPTITKFADKTTAFVGEEITYTICVSGVSNLNQLKSITDNFDPNLIYLGTDFNSNSINSLFQFLCNEMPNVSTGTHLNITFPECNVNIIGQGDFCFKVFTRVKNEACALKGDSLNNTVILNQGTNSQRSATATVAIKSGVPWELIKNFRNLTSANELVYDIRLNSMNSNITQQLLFNGAFKDNFIVPNCLTIDTANSSIVYIPNESQLLINQPVVNQQISTATNAVILQWDLPNHNVTKESYLFQVRLKVNNCSCPSTQLFNLNNSADFLANDICGDAVILNSQFNIPGVKCGTGPVIPIIEKDTVCVSKKVVLDNNNLNLTMTGCTGYYEIAIKNCSQTLTLDGFYLEDNLPSTSMLSINTSNVSITPNYTIAGIVLNGNTLELTGGGTLLPGESAIIQIPFTVITPLPNQFIKNCLPRFEINGFNPSDGSNFVVERSNVCDNGIKTVPNQVTLHTEKLICNSNERNCGGRIIQGNLPGDTVEYALHFYNYGTQQGSNIQLKDILPAHFTIGNINNDIKIYTVESGSYIDPCGSTATFQSIPFSTINSGQSPYVAFNATSRQLSIDFKSNHLLKPFTCSGVLHYVIKVKAVIQNTVINGSYNNMFKVDFRTSTNTPAFATSNVVTSTVALENLVAIFKNYQDVSTPEQCAQKTKTIQYEIKITNMGYIPFAYQISDILSIPSNVFVVGNVSNLEICTSNGSATCTVFSPIPNGNFSLVNYGFHLRNMTIAPCSNVIIRYKVTYNTNKIPKGQTLQVCNTARVSLGTRQRIDIRTDRLEEVLLVNEQILVNNYLAAKNGTERLKIIAEIKKEIATNKKASASTDKLFRSFDDNILVGQASSNLYEFIPIATRYTNQVCVPLSDCLGGNTSGCFSNPSGNSHNFGFRINSVDLNGKVNTTLNVNTSEKIKKIEYVLSEIVVRTPTCPQYMVCFRCNTNTTGSFYTLQSNTLGGLIHSPVNFLTLFPWSQNNVPYKEKNRVEFSNSTPQLLNGTYNKDFQLPINSLNCEGTLEFVITAIIYFEDCSVCYSSDVFDYNANFQWQWNDNQTISTTR
jgi:hypothetical protein